MIYCTRCGQAHNETYAPVFCSNCGTSLVQPIQKRPTENQYYPPYEPIRPVQKVDKGAKVMSFIGMGLGICGTVCAAFSLLFSFFTFIPDYNFALLYFFYTWVIGIEGIGASIPARILGNKAVFYGVENGPAKSARVMGLIGIIVNAIGLGIAFIGLITTLSSAGYYYY